MKLDLAILNALAGVPRALPVSQIANDAADYTGKMETNADTLLALKRLQKDGYVAGTDKAHVGTVWTITAEGKLSIA